MVLVFKWYNVFHNGTGIMRQVNLARKYTSKHRLRL